MEVTDKIGEVSLTKVISVSVPMLMTTAMGFLIGQTGVVILGMYRGEAEVGYYAIAVKLAMLTAFTLQAINSMAAPKFADLYHSGKIEELLYVAQKSAKLIFWTSVPVLLTLLFFGKFLLTFLFGKEFVVAYIAMAVLVVGQFVNAISGSTGPVHEHDWARKKLLET